MSRYGWQLVVGFWFLLGYTTLVLWARSACIARTNRAWTRAHRDALNVSLRVADSVAGQRRGGEGLAERLLAFTEGRADPTCGTKPSVDIADWVVLHEAQRQTVWLLPEEQVRARLYRAMGQLEELAPVRRAEWKKRYAELACGDGVSANELRSALVELLAELHNARDARYAQLAGLYNKAMWLMAAALLPLTVLLLLGYGVLLVAGAIGGLISRLQRLVYAETLPTAYGTSWVPLFCAPVLGALAAWAGLNLVTFLQAVAVIDLSTLVTGPRDLFSPPPAVLGVAVLFGFSERLLNRTGQEAERILASKPSDEAAGATVAPRTVRARRSDPAATATLNGAA